MYRNFRIISARRLRFPFSSRLCERSNFCNTYIRQLSIESSDGVSTTSYNKVNQKRTNNMLMHKMGVSKAQLELELEYQRRKRSSNTDFGLTLLVKKNYYPTK